MKRNNGGQEGTCEGKSDVRALWDLPGCNGDVSVDTPARCTGPDVTFSCDTVTSLYFFIPNFTVLGYAKHTNECITCMQ